MFTWEVACWPYASGLTCVEANKLLTHTHTHSHPLKREDGDKLIVGHNTLIARTSDKYN